MFDKGRYLITLPWSPLTADKALEARDNDWRLITVMMIPTYILMVDLISLTMY